ncbi:hemerythrin domain-containing protein [Sulfuricystis multivorans]|uniref:hemerythrin domain-containing protein n=1 Tax=Sulfuricystis multivorans TaxID=2211108 RepID=UPI000F845E62|nr:hemerythrin domain-containing protein [Sulfuricystis multivorans]
MPSLTEPLRHHHQHCDDLFVAAENAVRAGDWPGANAALSGFLAAMETHFAAEEETLFPAFEAATGMSMGPTRVMRHEHAQMRELFKQMEAGCADRDAEAYASAADTLLVMLQQHNLKEENILYPMCDQRLDAEAAALAPTLRERLEAA